jgi:hypothetical protein
VKAVYVLVASALALATCATACTSGSSAGPTRTVDVTTTQTLTAPGPSVTPTAAISGGPVVSATGNCPYLDEDAAAGALGIRLGRQAVLTVAHTPIGCQFFATTDPQFVASEHLPGPNQPVLQIASSKYANATIAHNAMAATGSAGGNAHTVSVSAAIVGVAYQTRFDPTDGASDWAYIFATGSTVVTILTAQSDSELDAQVVAGQIAAKF